jgi:hypothetical protein
VTLPIVPDGLTLVGFSVMEIDEMKDDWLWELVPATSLVSVQN